MIEYLKIVIYIAHRQDEQKEEFIFDKNNEIILYPIWEIECDYMFNPKKDMAVYEENKEKTTFNYFFCFICSCNSHCLIFSKMKFRTLIIKKSH